ncbi:MAG: SDR family oxidoreductase [Planctomycetota bacterium]
MAKPEDVTQLDVGDVHRDSDARVALITGGARRVGRATALHLARSGWDVVVTYFTSDTDAKRLRDDIREIGRACSIVRADFTNPEAATSALGDAVERDFGRLDLLMHNASIYEPGDLAEVDLRQLRDNWAVHCETPVLLTRRLAPLLRSTRGTVVTMTDIDLDRSRPNFLAYSMTKAGLANLTRQLARELAPDVTVNAIAPGAVVWAEGQTDDEKQRYLERVPLGRCGSAKDVARMVGFLCTDGKYMTGQTLRLDGGRSIR